MKFEIGQHIKCFLRTSMVIEGIVQESSEPQLILKTLDGESLLIVHQPAQDIVMTKVFLKEPSKEFPQPVSQEQVAEKIKEKRAEIESEGPSDEDLRHMSIAELHIEKTKQERRIVANRLRDHYANKGPRKVMYGYPRFFKKPSA